MPPPKLRTQFRVNQDLYTPVEAIRKEYERYRFLHQQIPNRVTTEFIIRTLLESDEGESCRKHPRYGCVPCHSRRRPQAWAR
jgi:hypothetical protein